MTTSLSLFAFITSFSLSSFDCGTNRLLLLLGIISPSATPDTSNAESSRAARGYFGTFSSSYSSFLPDLI